MLTKRANILFDEHLWQQLTAIAEKEKTSVGNIVRKAVIKVYGDRDDLIKKQRQQAFDNIQKLRKSIKHTFTMKEIKESIEYGRKY